MNKKKKYLILALGTGIAVVGVGLAIARKSDEVLPELLPDLEPFPGPPVSEARQPTEAPLEKTEPPAPTEAQPNQAQPAAAADQGRPDAGPQVSTPPAYFTKASIVLQNLPDPYNEERTKAAIAYNRAKKENSEAGKFASSVKTVIGFVPVVGQVGLVLINAFEALGKEIENMSRGGFDNLPLLVKKRIALYFWNTGGKQYKIKPTAWQTPQPQPGLTGNPTEDQKAYSRWLREFLIYCAIEQQRSRIIRTPDELMLPADIANFLNQNELWPPPVEPLPLSRAEWLTQYRKYFDRGWYNYIPASIPANMEAVAAQTYLELKSDYMHDVALYLAAIGEVKIYPDLMQFGFENDMVPPLGSAANPIVAGSRAERFGI